MDELDNGKRADTERRAGYRAPLSLKISIRERGRSQRSATLTNLSPFGCSVGDSVLIPGQQTVWVRLPGLERQAATLRWAKEGGAGLSFDHPLHFAVVNRFVGCGLADEQLSADQSALALQTAGVPGSRKEQILAGWAEPSEQILAKKQPRPNGRSLPGLIRRRISRSAERRLEKRYPPPIDETGRVALGEKRAKILNLSSSGLQVEFDAPVAIGSRLPVSFDGFAGFSAEVVWARQGRVGLALPRDSIELIEMPDAAAEASIN